MKKATLKVDYTYDFGLLGISSVVRPYKLAWWLNKELNVRLVRIDDHQVDNKLEESCAYTHYLHQTLLTTIRLFKNKPNQPESSKWALVPEYPSFDFIVMFKSDDLDLGSRLQSTLRNIVSIELVAFLPLAALKSKDNFIF